MAAPPPTRSSAPSAAGAASSPPPNLCQSRWRCSHCTEEQPGVTLSLSLGHCCGRRTVVCTAQLRDDRTRRALRAPPHTEIRRCTAPDAHAAVGARSRSARKRPQTLPRTTASRNPLPRSRQSMISLQKCLTPHTHAPAHHGLVAPAACQHMTETCRGYPGLPTQAMTALRSASHLWTIRNTPADASRP